MIKMRGFDAISRPSKPYLPPDRGFGHDGYAAISLSHKNATEFCVWLSARTGRKYRLPTVVEWAHAAMAGTDDVDGFAGGLAEVDAALPGFERRLRPGDAMIVCADHGVDPTTASTDHSREYAPLLALGLRPESCHP